MYYSTWQSPIGELMGVGDGRALHGLYMQHGHSPAKTRPGWEPADEPLAAARDQLEEYFAGRRRSFDLPLEMAGSAFEQSVWEALRAIPYGQTASYGEIARRVG